MANTVIYCSRFRKRYIYLFHCPEGPRLSFPILVDPNGLFVRREGISGMYMCSYTPRSNQQEPDPNDPKSGEEFFNNVLWPKLVYRAPVFSKLQVRFPNTTLRLFEAGHLERCSFEFSRNRPFLTSTH